jgi:hypothetical protein
MPLFMVESSSKIKTIKDKYKQNNYLRQAWASQIKGKSKEVQMDLLAHRKVV